MLLSFNEHPLRIGLSFGLTSGVIATLGLMVGLYSTTQSQLAVVGAILTISIADAFSDALGIHVSQETDSKYSLKEVWQASGATLLFKFLFALIFVIPVLTLSLSTAIWTKVILGLTFLNIFSVFLAKQRGEKVLGVVLEHSAIAILVIIASGLVGSLISQIFR
ncbi:MAG: hypothetical protein UU73_C0002G0155 [Candidatus Daviesbacteria bacterium GW2011_GWA1_41_61]|uniref:VIT family protein n=1 Tax=Candidatus Daviesbacteria bacterium GW2011_GWA2_40_9 TaxID=1618424 RepID=A0A0G0U2V5_9BACT|nr:MAG: hypothetical protein UU29_C0005G0014 [Candidatus Daviesbacteria bacterium GW2011_GWA2_40_9]KKR93815.1 MAG: hypothetical protein UU44_C0001G0155 [Candidatus Daviesbacteria bacterium GW2011_GWB1_41_15]KKS15281.1 MAG: hypothetical protein UU73_C0002G0155 [Candidatus Daviesbacteria bacterium GW2011_GWA1_41_61]